jgi:hypothetical protein
VTVANKISVIIDVAVDKGVTSLKKFRSAIGEAETASGKMRAGFDVAKESIVANAANIAMAAGGALVAFGVKSVKAFQDTALAAGAFADATGTSVEAASRWVEVAGDFGIEAGAVEGAMRKMNLAIANGKPVMDDFGDSIVRAKDGTVDSAATFQNLVTRIGAIKDPTARAKAAQEAFGKSYGDVARFMEMSAADLAAALGNVSEQKVIDEAELAKARKFQASMDELKDKLDDVTMTLGEGLVPILSDTADKLVWAADKAGELSDALENLTGSDAASWAETLSSPVNVATKAMDLFSDAIGSNVSATDGISYAWDYFTGNLEDGTTAIEYGTEAADEMAAMYAERVVPTADSAAESIADLEQATADLDGAYSGLLGKLSQQDAWDTFFAKMYEYHSSTDRSDQETRDYTRAVAEMVMALEGVPPETKAQMIATLDEGNIAAVESRLAQLARNRVVSIGGQLVGGGLRNQMEGRATGGPVTAGTPYIVGENGPEIVVPGRSGTVIPNNRIGVGGGGGMVINITTGADPQAVVAAIKKFEKSNGAAWRS